MRKHIELLDCTLRDGCYIVDSRFGAPVIRGIMKKLTAANVDIIECGWLKNTSHEADSAFYHVPDDMLPYLPVPKKAGCTYAVMMDWDRYDLEQLPPNDGQSADAVRVVFPQTKFKEAVPLGKKIKDKGYRLFFQAANTLGYSNEELKLLAEEINRVLPESLSIVDTFGAMYPEDLERIFNVLDEYLAPEIKLGFHSHNNQQLSFALSMEFVRLSEGTSRDVIVDSSLCGMGRGAGNTTTELLANFLNRKYHGNYDMNEIMDTIDLYMTHLAENYDWGYSIPYCIAGFYGAHVNNIAYLLNHHKTLFRDMRIIIESMTPEKRKSYDYGSLERIYVDYQNRIIDDSRVLTELRNRFRGKTVLLLGPGRTQTAYRDRICAFIRDERPEVVGINAIPEGIPCGYYFFVNAARYVYARENFEKELAAKPVILTSNIKRESNPQEWIVNFNLLCKLGWKFFDNSCIMCLRLMAKLEAGRIVFAGFDGFPEDDRTVSFYADKIIQPQVDLDKRRQINADVAGMLEDFVKSGQPGMQMEFLTPSRYQAVVENSGSCREEEHNFCAAERKLPK